MRIHDLSPDQMANILRKYLALASPEARKRALPLIKVVIGDFDDARNV
jgi:hypothetical protein